MSAYGSISTAKKGLIFGLDYEIESKTVPSGEDIEFGEPVFVDEGEEDYGYPGDDDDASLVFLGVAVISQKSLVSDASLEYNAYEVMNVLKRGQVWVSVPSGISDTANKKAYVIHDQDDSDYGKFTTTSGSNYDCNCYFRSDPTSDNLARVEVRGLN